MVTNTEIAILFIVVLLSILAIVMAKRNTFSDKNKMDCEARNNPGGDCVAIWGDDRICYKATQHNNRCWSNTSNVPMFILIGAIVFFCIFIALRFRARLN